ncbi:MAG TPA: MerR family transcriptional regulator [Patescibacteria group bacterium]|nr:MerR family transcriptional regulator [Patescibacteria group bacterium]
MLTISDLAARSGVAEQTLRRWLKQFSSFFPCREFGRQRKYPLSALETIRYIHEQFRAGEGTAAILASLQESEPQPPQPLSSAPQPLLAVPQLAELTDRLTAALDALAHRDQELAQLRQAVQQLTEQVTLLRENSPRSHSQSFSKADFRRLPVSPDSQKPAHKRSSLAAAPSAPAPVVMPLPAATAMVLPPQAESALLPSSTAETPPPATAPRTIADPSPTPWSLATAADTKSAHTPRPSETERIQRASEISKKTLECLIQTNADVEFLAGQSAAPWWRRLFHK